ncbi:hypothetical protein Tco_0015710 [Tanacetum coccineum]
MAQPQRQAYVHQDELCPPNKQYALMDANKKIDFDNPLCPNESKLLANILQNHPLKFSIIASSSVPWIYLGQTIFHLPQATDNNHDRFVPAPKFSEMVLFYINNIGFTLELRSLSNFKTIGLVQPWQTLCKMFSRCLTTRVTGYDQPPLQIMQMLYCFVNNIHVDLLWEGFHYSLKRPTTLIPYPRFTKLIVSHYMTAFPKISRRARDKYHNLEDDEMVKSIFNSGKNKAGVGMKIPSWMITDEMKLTENYRMYVVVFEVDVPTTQLRIPQRRSTRITPQTPIPTTNEADDIILQDTIKLSLAEKKSHEELESKQNEDKVKEHLMVEEIEKLVEGTENIEENKADSSTLSPEVEITTEVQPVNVNEEEEESAEDDYGLKRREKGKHVKESRNTPSLITIRSPRIHFTLISSDTEKLQELTVNAPTPSSSTPSSSSKLSATQRLLSLFIPKTGRFKRYKSFFDELQGRYDYLFGHLKTRFLARKKFNVLAQHLQEVMEESLPNMVDERVKELTKTQVPIYVAQGLIMERQQSQTDAAKMIADALQQERENLWIEITSQINNAITNHIPSQFDSSVENYMSGHILHMHPSQASPTSA